MKIEGVVAEQFREMELGDWSTVRGGLYTSVANSSTGNNYSCDEDYDQGGDVDLDQMVDYIEFIQRRYGYY